MLPDARRKSTDLPGLLGADAGPDLGARPKRRGRPTGRPHRGGAAGAIAAAAALVMLTGCSSSSAKPGYCADRTSLENSVKGLTSLTVSGGVSGLEAQLKKIRDDAAKLVSSAKGDFPSETSAIKSSVDALRGTVKGLPSSPSAADIASVATEAATVAKAVKGFIDASSSKCG